MATEVVVTVRSSGGDYTTISAAEAGEQRDLVAADEIAVIECYDDWPSGLSDSVTIGGWTTDSTRYVRLTVASGHRHDGTPQTGFHLLTTTTGNVLVNGQDFTRIEWIDIECTHTGGIPYKSNTTSAANYPTLLKCIAKATSSQSAFATLRGDRLFNCMALGGSNGYQFTNFFAARTTNCLAANCTTGFNSGTSGSSAIARNCVAYNNTNNYTASFWNTGTSTNNATSSGSDDAPGANSVTGIVSGDFADAANEDFHLASGSALIGAGADLSGEFTDDLDGDTRPTGSAWDIGPDHYVAAGGGTTVNAGVAAAQAAGHAAAVALHTTVQASPGAGIAQGHQAAVALHTTVQASPGAGTAQGHQAAIALHTVVDAGIGAAQAAGHAAAIALHTVVQAGLGQAVAQGHAATVNNDGGTTVNAGVGAAQAAGHAASLALHTTVQASPGAGVAQGHAAAVAMHTVVNAIVGGAVAAGHGATINVGAGTVINCGVGAAVAQGHAAQVTVAGTGLSPSLRRGFDYTVRRGVDCRPV